MKEGASSHALEARRRCSDVVALRAGGHFPGYSVVWGEHKLARHAGNTAPDVSRLSVSGPSAAKQLRVRCVDCIRAGRECRGAILKKIMIR